MTHYLKFPNEATAITCLSAYRSGGQWVQASHTHALDVIGTIYNVVEGADPVALPGFHVNLFGFLPGAAAQYEIYPATPARMFAGQE